MTETPDTIRIGARSFALGGGDAVSLRLCDAYRALGLGRPAIAPADHDLQMQHLETALGVFMDPWSRSARAVLSCYFRFVLAETAAHAEPIAARLAGHGDVFCWRDMMFMAPVPLPRAQIRAGDRIVRTAFAFCVEGAVFAIAPDGRCPGVREIVLDAASLADDRLFAQAMPREIARFHDRDALPQGPLGTWAASLPPG